MTNGEFRSMLEKRTVDFSVNVLRMLRTIPSGLEARNLKEQVARSSTAIGANYREANRAESRADFVHKIAIVAKEAAESEYWLLLVRAMWPELSVVDPLVKEAGELLRLFDSVRRSARAKVA